MHTHKHISSASICTAQFILVYILFAKSSLQIVRRIVHRFYCTLVPAIRNAIPCSLDFHSHHMTFVERNASQKPRLKSPHTLLTVNTDGEVTKYFGSKKSASNAALFIAKGSIVLSKKKQFSSSARTDPNTGPAMMNRMLFGLLVCACIAQAVKHQVMVTALYCQPLCSFVTTRNHPVIIGSRPTTTRQYRSPTVVCVQQENRVDYTINI